MRGMMASLLYHHRQRGSRQPLLVMFMSDFDSNYQHGVTMSLADLPACEVKGRDVVVLFQGGVSHRPFLCEIEANCSK